MKPHSRALQKEEGATSRWSRKKWRPEHWDRGTLQSLGTAAAATAADNVHREVAMRLNLVDIVCEVVHQVEAAATDDAPQIAADVSEWVDRPTICDDETQTLKAVLTCLLT